jgi:glycosyltransferase involved in cell wall biosynthesis
MSSPISPFASDRIPEIDPSARSPRHRTVLMTVDAVGGVWRYAMELARALRPRRYRIVFAGLGPKPATAQVAEAEALGELVWLGQPLDWMVDDPAKLSGVGSALADLAHHHDVDLIHLNAPSQAADIDARIPTLCVSHSCLPSWWAAMKSDPLPAHLAFHLEINQMGFDGCDLVVAPSGSHAQAISQRYRQPRRLEVVHNAISAFLHGASREPMLFAAGRWWDEGKNGAVLEEAAASIDWPIFAAGATRGPNGQEHDFSNVEALGPLCHRDVLAHAMRAEIVVSPSRYEPFGLAALEGARAGAALLLANIPTYRELWKGAAVFFDPTDPADLAEKANLLIADPNLRAAMGSMALARSRNFTPDRQARQMDELYRSLAPRVHLPHAVRN